MNNDNDNLRKLAKDILHRLEINDSKLTEQGSLDVIETVLRTITPAPLDREAMGKRFMLLFSEASLGQKISEAEFARGWNATTDLERERIIEAAAQFSALLPRDGGVCESKTLTCVYCGNEYPEGTPPHGAQILTDHIKVCEKHPMRQLEDDKAKLRKALAGLVGVDTLQELDGMEAAIRVLPVPDVDRMNTINAICALRDTFPQKEVK